MNITKQKQTNWYREQIIGAIRETVGGWAIKPIGLQRGANYYLLYIK